MTSSEGDITRATLWLITATRTPGASFIAEVTSTDLPDAHGAEVTGTDYCFVDDDIGLRQAFDLKVSLHQALAERPPVHGTGNLHLGQSGQLHQRLTVKCVQRCGGTEPLRRQVHRQRDDVVGAKTRIDRTQAQDALDHQTGAGQQNQRQCGCDRPHQPGQP